MAEEQARCILCHLEEKKERIVNRLIKRRIPPDEWAHFLEIPGHMDLRLAVPPDKRHPLTSNHNFNALITTPDKEVSSDFLDIVSAFIKATKKTTDNPNGENGGNLQTVAVGQTLAEITERTNAPSIEEKEEGQKEQKKQQLKRRRVPLESWDYYLENPELWNFADLDEDGLHKGITAIFTDNRHIVPCWVESGSVHKFIELKLKMAALAQTVTEIKKFSAESMLEDNQEAAERQQTQDRSDKLQTKLIASCNDLGALMIDPESCFGKNVHDNIAIFIEKARNDTKAADLGSNDDDDDTKIHTVNTATGQESIDEGPTTGPGPKDGEANVDADTDGNTIGKPMPQNDEENNDEALAADDDDTKDQNINTATSQEGIDEGPATGPELKDDKANIDADTDGNTIGKPMPQNDEESNDEGLAADDDDTKDQNVNTATSQESIDEGPATGHEPKNGKTNVDANTDGNAIGKPMPQNDEETNDESWQQMMMILKIKTLTLQLAKKALMKALLQDLDPKMVKQM